jgi:biopolymer transport protein ExbB/TolQ
MRLHASIVFFFLAVMVMAGNGLAGETARQGEQRAAVRKQLELRLADITQRIGAVKFKSTGMKDETRRELQRLREESKTKQDAARKKLSQLGSATGAEFDRAKAELNAAIEDLNNVYGRLSSLSMI